MPCEGFPGREHNSEYSDLDNF